MSTNDCFRQLSRHTRAVAEHETNRVDLEALENQLFEWPPTGRYCRVGSRLLKGQMLEQWQRTFRERPDRQGAL
jgi:hypothetical protein